MNRTDRLLAIVLELQRKGIQRAEDLAATFETSKRTIYRDILALCESGVPIVAQAGQGYSLIEGYFLPPVSFSVDEATMLLLGGDFVSQNFDAQYRDAAHSAGKKIEAVLSDKLRGEVQYLRNSITFVSPETLSRTLTSGFLPQLRRSIIDRKTIRFRYLTRYSQDGTPEEKTREADPYGLLHYGDSWYFIGHCHLRNEIRNFKVDRIVELSVLEKEFKRPPGFKMEPPEEDGRVLKIVAIFSKKVAPWVKEGRAYYVDSMEEVTDGLMVTMRVRMANEAIPWLLSWGGEVRILEPASIKRLLIAEAGKILENYSM